MLFSFLKTDMAQVIVFPQVPVGPVYIFVYYPVITMCFGDLAMQGANATAIIVLT